MIADINQIDNFLNGVDEPKEPLAEYVIEEDHFSTESEPDDDPCDKFKDVSRYFYIGDARHEFHMDDSIFMLASACLKSREASDRCRTCKKTCL